ncbi:MULTISPECIES: SRPBCC family protein [unclassified Aureispira]|uniref:SRPBCC family protein n=1 Tax=unclassified Aureispira TaxID=2649989 RepID=UPI0006968496|nr:MULTISPECIES: SRPBCC family protein [unclassified Aureispira]WMX12746.1 SRPBCC family protein [Aureispira sp. CCB-E]
MSTYTLQRTQQLPISLEKAWDFFSSPKNLKAITPDYMGFNILSGADKRTYPGQIIEYTVKPVLGIPMYWMTEITQVRELEFFIDEQRVGPYAMWHHQHFFKRIEGGVEMEDIVHYRLPLGPLGNIAHALFVKRQLEGIFDYRFKTLEKKWGTIHHPR